MATCSTALLSATTALRGVRGDFVCVSVALDPGASQDSSQINLSLLGAFHCFTTSYTIILINTGTVDYSPNLIIIQLHIYFPIDRASSCPLSFSSKPLNSSRSSSALLMLPSFLIHSASEPQKHCENWKGHYRSSESALGLSSKKCAPVKRSWLQSPIALTSSPGSAIPREGRR